MEKNRLAERPCYNAVIPAFVRYEKSISDTAKLFYGEISCLLDFKNRCHATNEYFSRLYGLTDNQVNTIIKKLQGCGFIAVQMIENKRVISLLFEQNELLAGNTHKIKQNRSESFKIPKIEDLKEHFKLKGSNEAEAMKFYNFYNSKGWMVGKNKMKVWKSAVANWLSENEVSPVIESKKIVF